VTNDAKDSVGLTREETIRRNAEELREAARILGVSEIVELGYETDCLVDVPLVALRERIVYLLRKHRPYAVFTFDPFASYEGNRDHVRAAQATEEAFWVACFDLHHPEHLAEGLAPFSVCERWYFARRHPDANRAEDVTATLERKIDALCAHRTMMRNTLNQSRLQVRTWGRRVPLLDLAFDGDITPLLSQVIEDQARSAAERLGLGEGRFAEAFRLERFGDLEELFQAASEVLPDAPPAPVRVGLDQT
jgi:LmbE family N-acetylglucosaminyl deacetylase